MPITGWKQQHVGLSYSVLYILTRIRVESRNLGKHLESLKDRHLLRIFTKTYLQTTLNFKKRNLFVKYYTGQCLITGRWFLRDYSLPTYLGYCFPIWFSFLSSIIEPIILPDFKNKDRKVCCRARLNDGISFISSQNWNRMRINWLKFMRRRIYKCPTFFKTKQFQFQRSYNCLTFSSNSLQLVNWIVGRDGRNSGWPTNFLRMCHNLGLACSKLPQILVASLMRGKSDI